MTFAQTNIGRFDASKSYQKATGEVILHFEGMRLNVTRDEWDEMVRCINGTPVVASR